MYRTIYFTYQKSPSERFVYDYFVNELRYCKFPDKNPSLQFWLMGFHQPFLSSLLESLETSKILCHARKSEPLIKYVILIISHVYLWYSVGKNST